MSKRRAQYIAGMLLMCCAGASLCGCATRRVWQNDNYSVQSTTNFTLVGYSTTNDDLILVTTNGQTFSTSLIPPDSRNYPNYFKDRTYSSEASKNEFRNQAISNSLTRLRCFRVNMLQWCDMRALQTGKTYKRTVPMDRFDSDDCVFVKPDADYMIWNGRREIGDLKLVGHVQPDNMTAFEPIDMPGVRLIPKRYNLWSIPVRIILTPFAVIVDVVGTPVCLGGYLIWAASTPHPFK